MTIYVPVYNRGAYECRELESSKCRILGGYIECNGTIYGKDAYTDPQGVWLYVHKDYHKAEEFRYRF